MMIVYKSLDATYLLSPGFFGAPFGPGILRPGFEPPDFPPPSPSEGLLGAVPFGPGMVPPRCCRDLRFGCCRCPVRGSVVVAGVGFSGSFHLPLRRMRSS